MKFKIGQKVRMKQNEDEAQEGDIGIIRGKAREFGITRLYAVEFPCFKESGRGHTCGTMVPSGNGHYITEEYLEPLPSFQEKLDRFMKEPVGFLVKSKEIADELAKVFERKHIKPHGSKNVEEFLTVVFNTAKEFPGDAYVCYNAKGYEGNLMCGTGDFMSEYGRDLLDVTLDELKGYLESTPQTLEDKLELFKAGTHVLHTPTQEIYDKLMVELEKRGYKWHNQVDSRTSHRYWGNNKSNTIVCCGVFDDNERVTYDRLGGYPNVGREVLELTLEDFRMGNAHRVSDSEQEEHMKITIETDGHRKTTAECNGITAESLCNPTDEFELPKGVHMAVQRLLEKLEEDTGFHVGDIVEVVANKMGFIGNPIGLQGVVKGVGKDGATINIPIHGSPLYFFNSELKLIRRGNN